MNSQPIKTFNIPHPGNPNSGVAVPVSKWPDILAVIEGRLSLPTVENHEPFTIQEATSTRAGFIRGVVLDSIAIRCGQVPDLHPRLLEGIEVAARRIANKETALPVEQPMAGVGDVETQEGAES
jgi:hypothetical protein